MHDGLAALSASQKANSLKDAESMYALTMNVAAVEIGQLLFIPEDCAVEIESASGGELHSS